jgi:hypothetical protein
LHIATDTSAKPTKRQQLLAIERPYLIKSTKFWPDQSKSLIPSCEIFRLLTIMMKIASALIQRMVRTSHGCSRAGRLGYTLPNLQTSDGQ